MTFVSHRPAAPKLGDICVNPLTFYTEVWDGVRWSKFSPSDDWNLTNLPTAEELEKYPALKNSWEEYLIIRRTIGL